MNAVEVHNLCKYYKTYSREGGIKAAFQSFLRRNYTIFKAVDQVSFQVKEGEILGVLGANGAGKTTLLKCLIGLLHPTASENSRLTVLGHTPSQRQVEFLRKVSIVLGQKNQLWWDLPAADSFELHRHIYRIPKRDFDSRLEELVTMLDVKDKTGTQVRRLSLGERMKMEIIAALLHNPRLVLLDEPTIGLDLTAQRSMRKFIQDYNKNHKTTFLITSHYMRDIEELCKRVLFVHKGRVLYDGALAKLAGLVPQDDKISAVVSERLTKDDDASIAKKLFEKFGARLEIQGLDLSCSVFHQHVGRVMSLLSSHYLLDDLEITAVSIEEAVNAIYNDPKKLMHLESLL